jgi:hypothetical protein
MEGISSFFSAAFADETRKATDPWYQFSAAIDEFNEMRRAVLSGSLWISLDETMSAWRPRKTALGGLPNISFIARKPEPLGKIKLKKLVLIFLNIRSLLNIITLNLLLLIQRNRI